MELSDGTTTSGKINIDCGNIIGTVIKNVKEGSFIAQQQKNLITIELPIDGIKIENGIDVKSKNTLFSIDLNNPLNYSLEIGQLKTPNIKVIDKINSIRESSLDLKNSSNIMKM
ncbi:hypothetical protein GW796_06370 [archaeon]|nr:hypothetical protein [archaeon]